MKILFFTLLIFGIVSCDINTKPKQKRTLGYIQNNNLQETDMNTAVHNALQQKTEAKISVFPQKINTNQINSTKLSQDNIKTLQKFISDAKDYHVTLNNIYNTYIKYINDIMTYTQCSESTMVFCTSNKNSQIRKNAIEKLNNSNIIQDLQALAHSIKDTNPQELNNSIESLKQAISRANLVKNNNNNTNNAFNTAKNASVAFLNTINSAIISYIDAFITITSNFNCENFIKAANTFAIAAKNFHKEVEIVSLSPIINVLTAMTFQLDQSIITQIKQYVISLNKEDDRYTAGTTFANSIDALLTAYKHATTN